MKSVLVCLHGPAAEQAVAHAAAQLGLGEIVTTAVGASAALARAEQKPADVVLVDTAAVRPDTVAFTRRMLERSPNATVVFFGPEESTVARGAVAAGARGLIRGGDREDLVVSVAKGLMLLLRGPQAVGELRTRTARMHAFADRAEVEATLRGLAERPEPLVVQLERRPGQREERWAHLLGPLPETVAAQAPKIDREVVIADGVEARNARVRAAYDAAAAGYALEFADELDDPSADLVVAALILNARLRGPGLREVLGALAASAREELDVRRKVEAERRSTRRSVQIVLGASLGFAALLIIFNPTYVAEYQGLLGQLVLLVVAGLFGAGFAWMRRLARFDKPLRLLAAPAVRSGDD